MGVTAVVPAYNEVSTIGCVVEVLRHVPLVDEVIVVDDGSRDGTAEAARKHGAVVLELPENCGKGAAMTAGARQAKGDILLFLDADLEGLTPRHVVDLLEPVLRGEADMTVGIFKSGRKPTDYAQVLAPSISGQRAMKKDLFLAAGVGTSRFEVEVMLTRFARERGLRVRRVPLANMTHVMKEEKRGIARGVVERMGMYKDITCYFWKARRVNRAMRPAFMLVALFLGLSLIGYNLFYIKNIKTARAEVSRLVHLKLWGEKRRILVISPHPDDESLAAGGLIAEAVKNGCSVHVVFLTSGDGFQRGLEIYRRKLNPGPTEFLEYGRQRMAEAESALHRLGLGPEDITFLGYPDGGLDKIWEKYRSPGEPYFSPRTKQSAVPYSEALSPGAPYTAPSIVKDLVSVMGDFQPTDIFLPDLEDGHPDHRAGGALAITAVAAWEQGGGQHAPRLFSYLVHAGLWQLVPKVDRNTLLLPPRNFLERGTRWYTLTLTPAGLQQKKQALASYHSQMKVISSFMNNFLRPNEIFSEVRIADVKLREGRQTVGADTFSRQPVRVNGGL